MIFTFVSFIAPIGFLFFRLLSPMNSEVDPLLPPKSSYILMLVQCILGVVVLILPSFIGKRFKIFIPSGIYCLYVIFLYCAIFLGEIRSFYYNVPHWDTILHTFSGAMIGAFGFSVIELLNKEERTHLKLPPAFVAIFAFCFSVALGTLWEVYEYTLDGILGLNMQKYQTEAGVDFVGRIALEDTMKDIIVDMLGALAMAVIGFISLKYKKGWVEKLIFRKSGDNEAG